jgi:hypothetical protein
MPEGSTPISDDDWRLQGQERYLQGRAMHRDRWTRPRPSWDHDHCEFCGARFMEENLTDVVHYGYTTADRYYWVCEPCFRDFRARFGWTVE